MQDVVVIGAGQAGVQVAESMRRGGYTGRLTLLGEERWPPYQRPPLSKKYLLGDMADERLFFRPLDFYAKHQIDLRQDCRVVAIDRSERRVVLAHGASLPYDALALTTGARIRALPLPGADHPAVHYLRGLDDAQALQQKLPTARSVVIVGGGFIGLEVAATARTLGLEVHVVEALDRLMARVMPPVVSTFFADLHRGHDVNLHFNARLTALRPRDDGGLQVVLADGAELAADLVVAGIGVLPNEELAAAAGITCANGIVVDEYARTSDPAIVAAGDCTWHRNLRYAQAHRLESVQNAVDQAKVAAATLLGAPVPYAELPWFWSDQYDVKLQIAGLSLGHTDFVLRGSPATGAFSVYYFAGEELLAVDSMNRPAEHMLARRLLTSGVSVSKVAASDPGFDLKSLLVTA